MEKYNVTREEALSKYTRLHTILTHFYNSTHPAARTKDSGGNITNSPVRIVSDLHARTLDGDMKPAEASNNAWKNPSLTEMTVDVDPLDWNSAKSTTCSQSRLIAHEAATHAGIEGTFDTSVSRLWAPYLFGCFNQNNPSGIKSVSLFISKIKKSAASSNGIAGLDYSHFAFAPLNLLACNRKVIQSHIPELTIVCAGQNTSPISLKAFWNIQEEPIGADHHNLRAFAYPRLADGTNSALGKASISAAEVVINPGARNNINGDQEFDTPLFPSAEQLSFMQFAGSATMENLLGTNYYNGPHENDDGELFTHTRTMALSTVGNQNHIFVTLVDHGDFPDLMFQVSDKYGHAIESVFRSDFVNRTPFQDANTEYRTNFSVWTGESIQGQQGVSGIYSFSGLNDYLNENDIALKPIKNILVVLPESEAP